MTAASITWISRDDPPQSFPVIRSALATPNGLLAAGGDLSAARLLYAYEHAIFPWFENGQPILWWSPDPRCVLMPPAFHVSRRLRRRLRHSSLMVTCNRAFADVIACCARPRENAGGGTWLTPGMIGAYTELHRLGWAHSVEAWLDDRLVGGVYGLAIGRAFFAESMFRSVDDASKIALLALCRQLAANNFEVLDCQVTSPHLLSLGATTMRRRQFEALVRGACATRTPFSDWPRDAFSAQRLGGD